MAHQVPSGATEKSYILEQKKAAVGDVPQQDGAPTGVVLSPPGDPDDDTKELVQMDSSEGKDVPSSSLPHASFNYINSIIGSGVIGLPYALRQAGFGLGLILLVLVALVTDYSLVLMIRGGHLSGTNSYQGLMEAAFGKAGFLVLSLLQFAYPFIAMVSYNVIVGDTVTKVVTRISGLPPTHFLCRREFVVAVSTLVLTLPLSLYRDMARMARISFLSLVFVAFILVAIWARLFTLGAAIPFTEDAWRFANADVMQAVGIMAFAFMCHHNTFLLYGSIRDASQQRWDTVTHASVATSLLISLLFAVGGYLTFTGTVQGDLLENYCYEDDLMNVSRCLFCVTILLTFPIECFVSREVIENLFFTRQQPPPLWRHVTVTVFLVFMSCLLSMTTDCLGLVLELNGVLAAVPLAYILPALCYLRLSEGRLLSREKAPALATAVFGSLVAAAGLLVMIVRGSAGRQCSHGHDLPYCDSDSHLNASSHPVVQALYDYLPDASQSPLLPSPMP